MTYLSLILLLGLSLLSNSAIANNGDASSAIRHQFKRWVAAYERGDADAVVSIYTRDAIILLPNMKPVRGRDKIRSILGKELKNNKVNYGYKILELTVKGDWAFRLGTATITTQGKKEPSRLKFIDIWKKSPDGKWRIARDISSIDVPASLIKKLRRCIKLKKGAAASLPTATLREYVGRYQVAPGQVFVVTLKGEQLYMQSNQGPAIPIYASAKNKFFTTVVDAKIDFVRDETGEIIVLVLHQKGKSMRASRIGD
jgi:uncharacterized protein (TIGR02246 family)